MSPTAAPAEPATTPDTMSTHPRPSPGLWATVQWLLRPIASLQLTVALFALSIFLVFFGTLAQMNAGIWTVVDEYFWSEFVWVPFQLLVKFGQVFFHLDEKLEIAGSFPFPAGRLIGFVMLANLIAAHLVRFRVLSSFKEISTGFGKGALAGFAALFAVFCKRGGIIFIHFGVVLLFIGEWGTRIGQVEQRMSIDEGSYADYAYDTRNHELAVIDRSEPDADVVTVVPANLLQRALRNKTAVSDPQIPFNIEVLEYADNSDLSPVAKGAEGNPATAGLGLEYKMEPQKEVSGVDPNQVIDLPSAILKLTTKDGKDLGTYMVSSIFSVMPRQLRQSVTVDGKEYDLGLRFTRYYKPFRIYLDDFRHDKYIGTNKAKNFASHVRIEDTDTGIGRAVVISMNEPLRYRGETFYQSSFDEKTESTTVLQVVRNPVWYLPYVACALVSLGMAMYFAFFLVQFLWRLVSPAAATVANSRGPTAILPTPSRAEKILPWAIFAFFLLLYYGGYVGRTTPKSDLNLSSVASIPVVEGGRQMPLDSKARVDLRVINDSEQFQDASKAHRSALQWFLDTASITKTRPGPGPEHRILRIENDQVLNLLELEKRPGSYRYSMEEVLGKPEKYRALQSAVLEAKKVKEKEWDVYQASVMELWKHIGVYHDVMTGGAPLLLPPEDGGEWRAPGSPDQIAEMRGQSAMIQTVKQFLGFMPESQEEIIEAVRKMPRAQQQAFAELIDQVTTQAEADGRAEFRKSDPAAGDWQDLLAAYRAGDQAKLDAAATALKARSGSEQPSQRTRLELMLNRSAPFFHAIFVYLGVILMTLFGLLMVLVRPGLAEGFRRTSFWVLVATFVIHTAALISRMYLMDRPLVFVTNLYSSAIFIGWAGVGLGLIVERIFPIGLGNLVAAILGAVGTFVAHQLALSGDTLEMMQAVLDTNFWLATHVTTVTLGYAATYVAGLVGLIYIVLGIMTPALTKSVPFGSGANSKPIEVGRMIGMILYGVICLATLLSFVGTVLGGIWADQSWGRFWGWDPKENGAVLIVTWNALILHARWAGLVKDRGVAVLALVGNMITTWSWFGTNQLGVGLHAYGFNNTLAMFCVIVWVSHLLLIAAGLVPTKYWTSFANRVPRV